MSTTPPQFGTAEYKNTASGEVCRACSQTIAGEYYRVNGALACGGCVEKVKQQMPKDSHAAFMRGILFGVGGAIAGLIVYSLFGIITGIMIGYVSLAVGWLVGKAMKAGSKGIGGRRYQVTAVLLTYAAVSFGAIPIWISAEVKAVKSGEVHATPSQTSSSVTGDTNSTQGSASADRSGDARSNEKPGLGKIAVELVLVGLASPFLKFANGPSAIIGLVILFVGMNISWKLTAAPKIDIMGPFRASTPAPVAPLG